MPLKPLAPLLLCLTATAFAQSAPPTPTTGPTMQQTIDFMKELYTQQETPDSLLQENPQFNIHEKQSASFHLEGECSLVVKNTVQTYIPGETNTHFSATTTVIDMAKSEPTSISIKPSSDLSPVIYTLVVGHAFRQIRSAVDAADDQPAIPLPPGTPARGSIQSIQGDTILFVNDLGRLISYKPDAKMKIVTVVPGQPEKVQPASLSDFTARDIIFVRPNRVLLGKWTGPVPSGYGPFNVLSVADNDVATKLATALIHAMVLCHKDDKPSLF